MVLNWQATIKSSQALRCVGPTVFVVPSELGCRALSNFNPTHYCFRFTSNLVPELISYGKRYLLTSWALGFVPLTPLDLSKPSTRRRRCCCCLGFRTVFSDYCGLSLRTRLLLRKLFDRPPLGFQFSKNTDKICQSCQSCQSFYFIPIYQGYLTKKILYLKLPLWSICQTSGSMLDYPQ